MTGGRPNYADDEGFRGERGGEGETEGTVAFNIPGLMKS